jgi:hypothetical protein
MTIAGALERFNECIRAGFLEWHIGLLKRRMEQMEIEKEAQHLKAAEARSTCKECEETSWTSKLRSTRTLSLSSRLRRKY